MKKRVLFLVNSLRGGGAEKVLVNLVNGLDGTKYDITVMTLFGEGINRQYLSSNIRFIRRFNKAPKGFVHWTKLLSPVFLHKWLIKDNYDVEVAYLQGVTTRIIAGASKDVRIVSWFHNFEPLSVFRSRKEMRQLFKRYDRVVGVSKEVVRKIVDATNESMNNICVVYNTQDVDAIREGAKEPVLGITSDDRVPRMITVGTLYDAKGYMRLLHIVNRLKLEGFDFKLWFVGDGPQRHELIQYVHSHDMDKFVSFFGFDKNPYKYMAKADWFICSSYTEGYSGTVSEATILGLPTLTTRCAGMDEILGENNEYGIIVDNSDVALYEGLRTILSRPSIHVDYKRRVQMRQDMFDPKVTIKQVENLIDSL